MKVSSIPSPKLEEARSHGGELRRLSEILIQTSKFGIGPDFFKKMVKPVDLVVGADLGFGQSIVFEQNPRFLHVQIDRIYSVIGGDCCFVGNNQKEFEEQYKEDPLFMARHGKETVTLFNPRDQIAENLLENTLKVSVVMQMATDEFFGPDITLGNDQLTRGVYCSHLHLVGLLLKNRVFRNYLVRTKHVVVAPIDPSAEKVVTLKFEDAIFRFGYYDQGENVPREYDWRTTRLLYRLG